ncbi:MAG: hypothetical protein ACJAR0_002737 [Candidatus Azotimanducaceae bacterium]|jgi:hypothetical protein
MTHQKRGTVSDPRLRFKYLFQGAQSLLWDLLNRVVLRPIDRVAFAIRYAYGCFSNRFGGFKVGIEIFRRRANIEGEAHHGTANQIDLTCDVAFFLARR